MKVLLLNLKEQTKLKSVLSLMDVEAINVEVNQYNDSLKDIIASQNKNTNIKNFNESILIMHEFSDEQIDLLLNRLKDNNIKIDLKCITTSYNITWNINKLHKELLQEKLAFLKQNKKQQTSK